MTLLEFLAIVAVQMGIMTKQEVNEIKPVQQIEQRIETTKEQEKCLKKEDQGEQIKCLLEDLIE